MMIFYLIPCEFWYWKGFYYYNQIIYNLVKQTEKNEIQMKDHKIYYSKIMKIDKLIALRHENRKLFITNEKIINTNRTLQHLI